MKKSRKSLVNALDKAHSLYIRNRDKKCVVCGTQKNLQCGHIFTRAAYSTRWDMGEKGNAHAQCRTCNMRHEYDPYPFNSWYIEKFGIEEWNAMHKRHKTPFKITSFQMEFLIKLIKDILAEQPAEDNFGL